MDATRIRESRLCDCKTCRCYTLVSPSGGTCGGCLTGVHYTYGSRPPGSGAPAYAHGRTRRHV